MLRHLRGHVVAIGRFFGTRDQVAILIRRLGGGLDPNWASDDSIAESKPIRFG